jgi:hypothetical protein
MIPRVIYIFNGKILIVFGRTSSPNRPILPYSTLSITSLLYTNAETIQRRTLKDDKK